MELLSKNPTLQAIFTTGKVSDFSEQEWPLHSGISAEHATALYRAIKAHQPTVVIEIGMAYGISSLAILTALQEIGGDRRLISIDPGQTREWNRIGVANVHRAGLSGAHDLIESYDYLALPELVSSDLGIDFAYVDGWHTFDYTLLDFFFIDKMLRKEGIVGFNDCGYQSVHRVCTFLQTHRKYEEKDMGLKPDYRGRNLAISAARRLLRWSRNVRYFQKLENWEPTWNFYARF
jgi:hypothetical protein